MTEYWQDKRLTIRDVALAWALVLVILAGMALFRATALLPCLDLGAARLMASACAEVEATEVGTAKRLSQAPGRASRQ